MKEIFFPPLCWRGFLFLIAVAWENKLFECCLRMGTLFKIFSSKEIGFIRADKVFDGKEMRSCTTFLLKIQYS